MSEGGLKQERPIFAAFDIGSNSIKMTVARSNGAGGLEEILLASETVRLGAGVDQHGRLAEDRIEAALDVLRRFADQALAVGAIQLIGVATEATRIAANGPAFLDRVQGEAGIDVRMISGDDESALTFRGMMATMDMQGRVVVADIGGGSTELIVATDGTVLGSRSIPLGSGRLTDRLVPTDPPTEVELTACQDAMCLALNDLPGIGFSLPSGADTRLIVVGGTGEYLGKLVGQGPIDRAAIVRVLQRLERVPASQIARELKIAEMRARVLPAGIAAVLALVDAMLPARIAVGRSGIRAGLLLDLIERWDGDGASTAGGEIARPVTTEG